MSPQIAAPILIIAALLVAIAVRVINAPPVLDLTADDIYPGRLAQAGGAKHLATGGDRHSDDFLASLVVGGKQ